MEIGISNQMSLSTPTTSTQSGDLSATFVIVGGGIGAVTCVEHLASLESDQSILLISGSDLVKAASKCTPIGQTAEYFEVEERNSTAVFARFSNVRFERGFVIGFDPDRKRLLLADGRNVGYHHLCIATGGKPRLIPCEDRRFLIGIRDTETVRDLQLRLSNCRRVLVVGNGGIATELVHELRNVAVVWAIRHASIAATFIDPAAAEFFLPYLSQKPPSEKGEKEKRKYICPNSTSSAVRGTAMGPNWTSTLELGDDISTRTEATSREVTVEYECQVTNIRCAGENDDWPCYVSLSNGHIYGCDLVVSATGVDPNSDLWIANDRLKSAPDGGIAVSDRLESSVEGVFAIGDVCSPMWPPAPHWMSWRLWTQARQMGAYCARSMLAKFKGEPECPMDICFEIFTHVTRFFGFKVIMLGRCNAQGLGTDYEALLRVTPGEEFIKVIVQNGAVQGALLIGETNLEETMENLILNGTNIDDLKDDLLNPGIDIEDYFD